MYNSAEHELITLFNLKPIEAKPGFDEGLVTHLANHLKKNSETIESKLNCKFEKDSDASSYIRSAGFTAIELPRLLVNKEVKDLIFYIDVGINPYMAAGSKFEFSKVRLTLGCRNRKGEDSMSGTELKQFFENTEDNIEGALNCICQLYYQSLKEYINIGVELFRVFNFKYKTAASNDPLFEKFLIDIISKEKADSAWPENEFVKDCKSWATTFKKIEPLSNKEAQQSVATKIMKDKTDRGFFVELKDKADKEADIYNIGIVFRENNERLHIMGIEHVIQML